MKEIGIFTTFYQFADSFSLTSVVREQLEAHLAHGYKPVLFVLENFKDFHKVPDGVEVRAVLPQVILEPYKGNGVPDCWEDDYKRVRDAVEKHCADMDFLICHDIIFIDTYLPYNIGLKAAKIKAKKLHWIHSAPSPRPFLQDNPHAERYNLGDNALLVYLNSTRVVALAEMYGTTIDKVRVVNNSVDPRILHNYDDLTRELIRLYNLMDADIISVYPLSTPRMIDGKQLDKAILIHAGLRREGYDTRLIVPNAHANGAREKVDILEMKQLALREGLEPHQIIFTSDHGWEHGVDRRIVSELFLLSNMFIFPSISENCPLILMEAMLAGNLLVLNEDCISLKDFAGDNALYFKFGNLDMGTRNNLVVNNPNYYQDIAKIVGSEFSRNKALKAKASALRRFNYDSIFKQMERIYYE